MNVRRCIAVAALAAWLAGCAQPDDDGHATDRFPALGTLVEITLRGVPPETAESAFVASRDVFDAAQHDWHAWGDGALGRYNAALANGRIPESSPELDALLARAATLERASGGLFNPLVGRLVEAWGFHRTERPDAALPDDIELARWLALSPTLNDLPELVQSLEPERHRLLVVDLGALAKGTAVAASRERLREMGIEHALINAGGDIAALGDAGSRPWSVGIRDPRRSGVVAGIELHDGEAVFTSGDYERAFEQEGERWHHILDPRTARPARGTASMTVLHADPETADAAATALFIAGPDWPRVAAAMGVRQAMRITVRGEVEILAPLESRIEFARDDLDLRVIDAQAR